MIQAAGAKAVDASSIASYSDMASAMRASRSERRYRPSALGVSPSMLTGRTIGGTSKDSSVRFCSWLTDA